MVVMHYRAYESLRYGYPYDVDLKLCFDIRTLHNYFIWLYGLPHVGFVFFSAGHFMLWVCHTAQAYYSEPLR